MSSEAMNHPVPMERLGEMLATMNGFALGAVVLRGDDLADVRACLTELQSLRTPNTGMDGVRAMHPTDNLEARASALVKRLIRERDRHVTGYPGPRRDVAELLDDVINAICDAAVYASPPSIPDRVATDEMVDAFGRALWGKAWQRGGFEQVRAALTSALSPSIKEKQNG